MTLFPRILELLRKEDAEDIVLFGGGTIPDDDARTLKQLGVAEIFTPGASTLDIVEWVRTNVGAGAGARSGR
jgi:methylmalonyl-CoA mutase C-terminal domain/subunit